MVRTILIVEDNPADAETLQLALARRDPTIEIIHLEDGPRAVEFLSEREKRPPCSLIVLDVDLPRLSGIEVLKFLKADPELKKTPVVMFSGSRLLEDIERCYAAGANSYISKVADVEELYTMAARLVSYWFDCVDLPREVRSPSVTATVLPGSERIVR